jgi:hypothetical protein
VVRAPRTVDRRFCKVEKGWRVETQGKVAQAGWARKWKAEEREAVGISPWVVSVT